MGRKVARESAMKLLFQMEVNNDFSTKAMDIFFDNSDYDSEEKSYIRETASAIIDNLEVIDSNITKYAQGWKLTRIAKVDLTILRIAIYEILFRDDIPLEVSINEALEISKKYSTSESGKFINGLLGSFVRARDESNG